MTEPRRATRRVTLNVDEEHLREAAELLGTTSMTDTINRSLDEAVRLRRRQRLAERRFEDLTLDVLRDIRAPRTP